MLQIQTLIEDKERAIQGLQKRGIQDAAIIIDKAIQLDKDRKEAQASMDECLSKSNLLAKQIGQLMKSGKREEAEGIKQETAGLKAKGKELGEALNASADELQKLLYNIPNIPNSIVPEGKSEENNKVLFEKNEIPQLDDGALPHWELIKKYDIIDFDLGNKITGAGFPVYKGQGAQLQRALINFFLAEANKAGYLEIMPPIVVNEASGYGTGQLPDKEGMMYCIPEGNLYMIPTAEVPITNLYRDVLLKIEELPIKNAGYTPCFRREAGSWGAHVRGLNRLHQFDKVEIVQVQLPENSYQALEDMCAHVEGLLEKLELPFRKLLLCAGDLGFTSCLTFDMEVYSAAQEQWLEVSSISNFETYQANRLKLRYKNKEGKNQLLHTLNGSALALPRIVAALLENNQTSEGIKIPKALIPYCGFDMIKNK